MTTPSPSTAIAPVTVDSDWWRHAVVYQVYIRSFADGDGDGVGDIRGVIDRLPYLARLGVDAIWVTPWYRSPMADGGYDVADYRAIDPAFGTLADAEELLRSAHDWGIRVILDIVPNHTSRDHAWFQAALAGDARARARYLFRDGRGPGGDLPPNDWVSAFGGSAWERERRPDGTAGQWYLHMYAVEQPDLDWSNDEVRAEFADILHFWFGRGADGLRIDVAHGLVKAPGLPDGGRVDPARQFTREHPAWDQPGVHEIYRAWRAIADAHEPPRVFVAEAWVSSNEQLALYLRPDELHSAFQIDMLFAPWRAEALRETISASLAAAAQVGAPSTWVLSNHDVPRNATRYARSQPEHPVHPDWERRRWASEAGDPGLGARRARAAALLVGALPGSLYLYQGEELGLPEVEDLPDDARRDPTWWQSGFTEPGRDGCRVPIPWSRSGRTFGFGPDGGARSWLPQPATWGRYSVEAQEDDPDSMLHLQRAVLAARRGMREAPFEWLDAGPDVVAFARGDVECWVNLSNETVRLPGHGTVELASSPGDAAVLAPDAAVYLRRKP